VEYLGFWLRFQILIDAFGQLPDDHVGGFDTISPAERSDRIFYGYVDFVCASETLFVSTDLIYGSICDFGKAHVLLKDQLSKGLLLTLGTYHSGMTTIHYNVDTTSRHTASTAGNAADDAAQALVYRFELSVCPSALETEHELLYIAVGPAIADVHVCLERFASLFDDFAYHMPEKCDCYFFRCHSESLCLLPL
jgi:hypothetical protein